MPFKFTRLSLDGVVLIEPVVFSDERGFFLETYKASDFISAGITEGFTQENHSRSFKNVLRGLHYQIHPYAQGKLVRCISGEILDVAVDIRRDSKDYKRWFSEILSAQNCKMLYIPPGFAHGFLVLSETADVVYLCTKEYSPTHDRGIIWNDPDIAIDWGITQPILSKKDASLPRLIDAENNF
ncbi:MAG: dTDP-4-dehydrorhamnose 3,5-epimerase [Thermodesulfovibrionales bacterium]|nr:dTDP-4-dehydrorhamnose 3,5-epimerase [Thermodesulfovibrionales bacterium]